MAKEMSPKDQEVFDDVGTRGIDALRNAKKGWKQIISGNRTESRQERILRERREGIDSSNTSWKPGEDDEPSDNVSLQHLRENHKRMVKKELNKKIFEGTADLVTLKLVALFENDDNVTHPKILSVEESGFGTFKITYIPGN